MWPAASCSCSLHASNYKPCVAQLACNSERSVFLCLQSAFRDGRYHCPKSALFPLNLLLVRMLDHSSEKKKKPTNTHLSIDFDFQELRSCPLFCLLYSICPWTVVNRRCGGFEKLMVSSVGSLLWCTPLISYVPRDQDRARQISELGASLVYLVSSRSARVGVWGPAPPKKSLLEWFLWQGCE